MMLTVIEFDKKEDKKISAGGRRCVCACVHVCVHTCLTKCMFEEDLGCVFLHVRTDTTQIRLICVPFNEPVTEFYTRLREPACMHTCRLTQTSL